MVKVTSNCHPSGPKDDVPNPDPPFGAREDCVYPN